MTTTPYPYLIFYEATDAEIIIHAVRHGARSFRQCTIGVSPRRTIGGVLQDSALAEQNWMLHHSATAKQ
jgi:hypothetical protein